ncbi:D-alanyl-D-alanine carboxypeptidase/D-alanyl-D-alanine-endopeptidase [bacterium]|nr:D-alanyl-D-alanine carboxypeptidase/D-alanyl-D-alanine-endopeptidase [bacterium]
MKNFLKLFIIIFCLLVSVNSVFCDEIEENPFDKIIENSPLKDSSTISVSIKKAGKNPIVYERDSKKLLHPASTLKLITIMPELSVLTDKYLFKTQIFYDEEKNVYIKLGADPYLTSDDLKNMLFKLKDNGIFPIKTLYIDSTIMDGIEWGVGWMWDNDTNPLMPKYSAFNLDQNLIKIKVQPTNLGEPAKITSSNTDTTTFMNYVTTSADTTDICVARFNWISPNLIYVQGSVAEDKNINIPVSSAHAYFVNELKKHLKNIGISYEKIAYDAMPEGKTLLTEKVSGIERAVIDILQNSKNLMAETTLKIAAHKYTNSSGSTMNGIDLINDYYKNISKNSQFNIVDASGVSHNNLVTTDFITEALIYNQSNEYFDFVKSRMATPSIGTMKNRLLDYKNSLWVKTGTLSGISGITGYATSKSGENYVFSILIQNYGQNSSDAKNLEDEIIKAILEL